MLRQRGNEYHAQVLSSKKSINKSAQKNTRKLDSGTQPRNSLPLYLVECKFLDNPTTPTNYRRSTPIRRDFIQWQVIFCGNQ